MSRRSSEVFTVNFKTIHSNEEVSCKVTLTSCSMSDITQPAHPYDLVIVADL